MQEACTNSLQEQELYVDINIAVPSDVTVEEEEEEKLMEHQYLV